jgi:hypothetical protein
MIRSHGSGLPGAMLALLALVLPAPSARADAALFLTWDECALGANALHDRDDACDSDAAEHALYCAFRVPFAVDSVLGLEIVVDVQHSEPVMPDWWRFAPGACRAGALSARLDFTQHTDCADFLHGNAAGGLQGYYVGEPRGGANQARIKIAATVLPGFGYATLNATDTYYGAKLVISGAGTVPPGLCEGCAGSACLVFNSVLLRRQPGAVGGDVLLTTPGPGNAHFATWQHGTGVDCTTVPVRPVTWGRLKSLYR